jgi:hypothetical protein
VVECLGGITLRRCCLGGWLLAQGFAREVLLVRVRVSGDASKLCAFSSLRLNLFRIPFALVAYRTAHVAHVGSFRVARIAQVLCVSVVMLARVRVVRWVTDGAVSSVLARCLISAAAVARALNKNDCGNNLFASADIRIALFR